MLDMVAGEASDRCAAARGPGSVLQILDPGLDQKEVLERIHRAIRARQSGAGYGPDVAGLGPEALRPQGAEEGDVDPADWTYLQAALDDLALRSDLREPQFHSGVPVLGPWIVRMRRAWNWMAAKWYVRGWMDQQMQVNRRLLGLLSELLYMQAQQARRIQSLEHELEALKAREH
jgi:hypothetical protein